MPTRRPVSWKKSRAASIMQSAVGQGRVHADLAGRGLDEVGAGRHREHATPAGSGRTTRARPSRGSPSGARRRRPRAPRRSSSNACAYWPPRKSERFSTMSTSSAPRPTTSRISAQARVRAARARREPAGHARHLHAGAAQLLDARPGPAAGRCRRRRPKGPTGRRGFGRTAFEHIATILPTVSLPSRVVRSMQRIARSSAHSLVSRLIERVASEAARSSRPTASTAGARATSRDASARRRRPAWRARSARSRLPGTCVAPGRGCSSS